MDQQTFNHMADDMDSKINMVSEFIERAHQEGISTIEAVAMQNHVRREFSPKQRTNFRQQIASLYRGGNITIEQKERMDRLLDKASKIADEHFLKLSRIAPESQTMTAPRVLPKAFTKGLGDNQAKKIRKWLGLKES